jgi:antitoxin (DNA-binding transcriptional repressor) of toxin-antitoxin stability system
MDVVAAGQEVIVTRRGRPRLRLTPAQAVPPALPVRLDRPLRTDPRARMGEPADPDEPLGLGELPQESRQLRAL